MTDSPVGKGAALFIIGVAAGAVAAMLSTPRNGREIRERLKRGINNKRFAAEEKMDEIEESLRDARDTAKDRLNASKLAEEGLTHK